MRKIFICIPWFLPAFRAGGPVQSIANLVENYTGNFHYFIFTGDTDLNGAALNVATSHWLPYNEHSHVWYANANSISDDLVKQVERIKPDVLFIVGMYSWHFNIVPLLYCKVPRKIISARGMLHPAALRQKRWKKMLYLKAFRLLEYPHKVQFHATDQQEVQYIESAIGKPVKVFTAQNYPNLLIPTDIPNKIPGRIRLISIGIISPMKNYLLVLQALSKLKADVEYEIYGPVKDEGYWDECKEKIKHLPANIAVRFFREISPDKVAGVLANAHVFILPSKSENFGHAIVEALSAGRPVITSNFTPWNRLKTAKAGLNVETDDGEELCNAITFFATMESTELQEWGIGAAQYAIDAINKEAIGRQYREMFGF